MVSGELNAQSGVGGRCIPQPSLVLRGSLVQIAQDHFGSRTEEGVVAKINFWFTVEGDVERIKERVALVEAE